MKELWLLSVMLCFITREFGYVQAVDRCEDGWKLYNSKCYSLNKGVVSYWLAKTYCEDEGSTLASGAFREESAFLESLMYEENVVNAWVGLRFLNRNCTNTETRDCLRKGWRWKDGTEYTYPAFDNWKDGQPELADKCAYLDESNGWVGAGCGTSSSITAYTCEKDLHTPTTTTTTSTTTTTATTTVTTTITTTTTTTTTTTPKITTTNKVSAGSSMKSSQSRSFSSAAPGPTSSAPTIEGQETRPSATEKPHNDERKTLVLVVIVIYSLLAINLIILVIEVIIFYRRGQLPCQKREKQDTRVQAQI